MHPLQGRSLPDIAAIVFAFFAGLTLVSLAMGFGMTRSLSAKKKIFDIPIPDGQLRLEMLGNVIFVAITSASFTAVLASGATKFGPDSLVRGALTFVGLLFGFQAFYYWLHRAMHHRVLLRFHRWHHVSQVTSPLSGQSVSPVEACGWMIGYVVLPMLVSWVVPLSFWGYVGYMAFNVFGNIVGHANVEPTAKAAATRAASWFANPFVYHSLHHARWTGHYSFQAATMDRLFKTEYADWPELYERVSEGRPLTSLKDRGAAK